MGCDMVTALGRATADQHTLFGHSAALPPGSPQAVRLNPGRPHEPGERIVLRDLQLPQVRQTATVLGATSSGWGYQHGVNEHGVAAGRAPLSTRLSCPQAGLLGDELVRLILERAHSAQQGIDLLTDLIRRHGQGTYLGASPDVEDSAFLIADAREAFALEAAGPFYAWQQVRELRALGPLGTIRQDWDWIAPGLSDHVLDQGWWPADGSKIDFAGSVCPPLADQRSAARRWGGLTRHLSEQNGHIDVAFLRRLLSDTETGAEAVQTPTLVVELSDRPNAVLIAWTALGPTRLELFFPLLLEGDLPAAFVAPGLPPNENESERVWSRLARLTDALGEREQSWDQAHEALARLQARFDQDAEEFVAEAEGMKQQGRHDDLRRQATLFMQHCLERFEEVADGLAGSHPGPRPQRLAAASVDTMDVFEG